MQTPNGDVYRGVEGATVTFEQEDGTQISTTTDSTGKFCFDEAGKEVFEGAVGKVTVTNNAASDYGWSTAEKSTTESSEANLGNFNIGLIKSLSVNIKSYNDETSTFDTKSTFWCPAFKDSSLALSDVVFYRADHTTLVNGTGTPTAEGVSTYKMSDMYNNGMVAQYCAVCTVGTQLHCYQISDGIWDDIFKAKVPISTGLNIGDMQEGAVAKLCDDNNASLIHFDGSNDSPMWRDNIMDEGKRIEPTVNGIDFGHELEVGGYDGFYGNYGGNGGLFSAYSYMLWSSVSVVGSDAAYYWMVNEGGNWDAQGPLSSIMRGVVLSRTFPASLETVTVQIDDESHGSVTQQGATKVEKNSECIVSSDGNVITVGGTDSINKIIYKPDSSNQYKLSVWKYTSDAGKTYHYLRPDESIKITTATQFIAQTVTSGTELYCAYYPDGTQGKNKGTLTWYYDDSSSSRQASCYIQSNFSPVKADDWSFAQQGLSRSSVKYVEIDSSLSSCHLLKSTAFMFSEMASTIKFSGFEFFNVSGVVNMESMFFKILNNVNVTSDDIPNVKNWDTSTVVSMKNMFSYMCDETVTGSFVCPEVEKWNTSKVQDFSGMFAYYGSCFSNGTSVPNVTNWDTSSVTTMQCMFFCYARKSVDVLDSLDLSGWDITNLKISNQMFSNYNGKINSESKVTTVYGSEWNQKVPSGVEANQMFQGAALKGTGMDWTGACTSDDVGRFTKKEYKPLKVTTETSDTVQYYPVFTNGAAPAGYEFFYKIGDDYYKITPADSSIGLTMTDIALYKDYELYYTNTGSNTLKCVALSRENYNTAFGDNVATSTPNNYASKYVGSFADAKTPGVTCEALSWKKFNTDHYEPWPSKEEGGPKYNDVKINDINKVYFKSQIGLFISCVSDGVSPSEEEPGNGYEYTGDEKWEKVARDALPGKVLFSREFELSGFTVSGEIDDSTHGTIVASPESIVGVEENTAYTATTSTDCKSSTIKIGTNDTSPTLTYSGKGTNYKLDHWEISKDGGNFSPIPDEETSRIISGTTVFKAVTVFAGEFTVFSTIELRVEPLMLPSGVTQISYPDHGAGFHDAQHGWSWFALKITAKGPIRFKVGSCSYQAGNTAYGKADDVTFPIDNGSGCDSGTSFEHYGEWTYLDTSTENEKDISLYVVHHLKMSAKC